MFHDGIFALHQYVVRLSERTVRHFFLRRLGKRREFLVRVRLRHLVFPRVALPLRLDAQRLFLRSEILFSLLRLLECLRVRHARPLPGDTVDVFRRHPVLFQQREQSVIGRRRALFLCLRLVLCLCLLQHVIHRGTLVHLHKPVRDVLHRRRGRLIIHCRLFVAFDRSVRFLLRGIDSRLHVLLLRKRLLFRKQSVTLHVPRLYLSRSPFSFLGIRQRTADSSRRVLDILLHYGKLRIQLLHPLLPALPLRPAGIRVSVFLLQRLIAFSPQLCRLCIPVRFHLPECLRVLIKLRVRPEPRLVIRALPLRPLRLLPLRILCLLPLRPDNLRLDARVCASVLHDALIKVKLLIHRRKLLLREVACVARKIVSLVSDILLPFPVCLVLYDVIGGIFAEISAEAVHAGCLIVSVTFLRRLSLLPPLRIRLKAGVSTRLLSGALRVPLFLLPLSIALKFSCHNFLR